MTACVFNPALSTSAKVVLAKFPLVEFATQQFIFPELTAVFPTQAYPTQTLHMPPAGVTYGLFTLNFMVDAQLENYREIVTWIQNSPTTPAKEVFSDATVIFTNTLKQPTGLTARFTDMMPIHVTSLQYQYNTQDPQPLVAVATFKYTKFIFE